MPVDPRVLVVGTTSDYVDWLRRARPGRALFLTDSSVREGAREAAPGFTEEITCDLADEALARATLSERLPRLGISLGGVACFDCESMPLAAAIARDQGLSYPAPETIGVCRDKHRTKERWRREGVPCPSSAIVGSGAEAARFQRLIDRPCVLKPSTGSGSELVFVCATGDECVRAFEEIERELGCRADHRLYRTERSGPPPVVAEELLTGPEYSADFVVEGGRVEIIRLSRKLPAPDTFFGTIRGYTLTAFTAGVDGWRLAETLARAAGALGISRAICMADFFARGDGIALLELTPRPGGDCLPSLLRHALGLDILSLTLDFAAGRPAILENMGRPDRHVGLRLFADRAGVVASIDSRGLGDDPRIRELTVLRAPGHVVRMPPDDYESWLLGHLVFEPDERGGIAVQCEELAAQLELEISP